MTERFQKSPNSMGFLNFSTSAAFDNIDLPLLNPELYWFTYYWFKCLFSDFFYYLRFLPLALLPSLCAFGFLFWDSVHLYHLCGKILKSESPALTSVSLNSLYSCIFSCHQTAPPRYQWYLIWTCLRFNFSPNFA